MSKERWTEVKTRKFVLSYLQKPMLWNSSMPEYCQKNEKERAYGELMTEFDLTIQEVRNKIRIFRTTFNQEKKKEETISNFKPKLSWYQEMKSAFEGGKIKSFSKSFSKVKSEMKKEAEAIVQFEYENESEPEEDDRINRSDQHIIIEPYDEYEVEDDTQEEIEIIRKEDLQPPAASNQNLPSSNELFLNSLKSTLDKLPDEKNMRARIAIQEVLYKIMYEKEKL